MPRRLLEPGHRIALVLTIICAGVIFVSMGGAGVALLSRNRDQDKTNRIVCLAINNENSLIVKSLERSKLNIPKLDYYKHHPAERDAALRQIDEQRHSFRPRTC